MRAFQAGRALRQEHAAGAGDRVPSRARQRCRFRWPVDDAFQRGLGRDEVAAAGKASGRRRIVIDEVLMALQQSAETNFSLAKYEWQSSGSNVINGFEHYIEFLFNFLSLRDGRWIWSPIRVSQIIQLSYPIIYIFIQPLSKCMVSTRRAECLNKSPIALP